MTTTSKQSIENEIYIPFLALFFGAIGLILSLVANFNCRFISNQVIFTEQVDDNQISTLPYAFRSGIWNFEDHNLFYVIQNQSIFVVRYDYCIPWKSGQTTVDEDAYWIAAKVFSIISVVVGGMVGMLSCCLICTSDGSNTTTRRSISVLGWTYLFITLCQGLTFLFLNSNICSSEGGTAKHGNQEFELQWTIAKDASAVDGGCKLGSGGNCSIASMVFYFTSSMILFGSIWMTSSETMIIDVPTRSPRGDGRDKDQKDKEIGRGEDEGNQGNVASPTSDLGTIHERRKQQGEEHKELVGGNMETEEAKEELHP